MKRGDIVIAADRGEFTTKPRPYLVVQRQSTIADSSTVTVCPMTTMCVGAGPFRIAVAKSAGNGLDDDSEVEVDRIVTIRQRRVRQVVGSIEARQLTQVDAALRLWLDL